MTGTGKSTGTGPLRVLLVEDDDSIARVLGLSLTAAGFEVSRATTDADALRLLQREPVEAVILDLDPVGGRGRPVLEWLRKLDPHRLPAWVVISALDREEATMLYGPLGTRFFAKPFDPWELVRTLEQLLKVRREQPDPRMGVR